MTLWFVHEAFTDEERARLEPHFTDLDGPVFALTNLPEVVKGAMFARYSRTPKSLRRLFLDEFAEPLEAGEVAGLEGVKVDKAEQLFADVLDPGTGEPVLVQGATVLVMPAYRFAAHRVFNATELRYTATGAATTTVAANPLTGYRLHDSRLAYRRVIASGVAAADAKKWWFLGDFRRAFAYMENWPITVTQAPVGSEAEFNEDIVLRFKASERGAAAVLNPRYVVKNTG